MIGLFEENLSNKELIENFEKIVSKRRIHYYNTGYNIEEESYEKLKIEIIRRLEEPWRKIKDA